MRMPKSSSFSVRDILDLPRTQADDTQPPITTPISQHHKLEDASAHALRHAGTFGGKISGSGGGTSVLHQHDQLAEELRRRHQFKQVR